MPRLKYLITERCPGCGGDAADNWFDRSICPASCLSMHTRCCKCGSAIPPCPLDKEGED
jgi:hypothetical protein